MRTALLAAAALAALAGSAAAQVAAQTGGQAGSQAGGQTGAQPGGGAPAGGQRLTPERVFQDPGLSGPTALGLAFSPDGKRITYLKAKTEDRNVTDLWAADVAGGEPYRLLDAKALSSGDEGLSEAEIARRERQRIGGAGVVEYKWDSQGKAILAPVSGDLYLAELGAAPADTRVRRLTQTDGDEVDGKISPRGGFVSYVRDQNLYVMPLTGGASGAGAERALTTGGKDTLSFGVAEFIAQEELGRFTGQWWAPDDSRIAFTRVDESPVDVVPRADIGPAGATVVQQRYPRAGRPNAVVELFIQGVAAGQAASSGPTPFGAGGPIKVDLKAGLAPDADIYLARVDWAADGRTVYVQRLTRDQRTLDLLSVDPATGAARVIVTQKSPHFIELTDDFKALKDGTFLWANEDSGHRHLYLYARDGKLIRQVTKGDWPVRYLSGVDEAAGRLLFAASKDTPIESRVWSVSYRRAEEPKALTGAGGWWNVEGAPEGGAFVGFYSDPKTPPQSALYDAAGKRVRWIEENALKAGHPFAPYVARLRTPTYGVLKASDGKTDLHYAVTTPVGFDPKRKYPAVVLVYGGPHVQTVTKGWGSPAEQLFSEAGYVVFRLDNRGSDNRSKAFKDAIDRALGTVEVEDQVAGITWLKSQPYVDPARVGVSGWSYGGYMSLMLLTEPRAGLKAGVSGAPPTDWSLYDTAYTERYLGTPQGEKAAYARSEVMPRTGNLKDGSLLLMHGMADDNVIFENSTKLMTKLQREGKVFDSLLFPGERHGAPRRPTVGLSYWRNVLNFFDRTLQPGG